MKPLALAPALAALLAASSFADEVVTKAGTVYGGKIVAEDAKSVTVDSPALGRMCIARGEIASLKRDAAQPAAPVETTPAAETPAGPSDEEVAAALAKKRQAEAEASAAEAREAVRRSAKLVRRTAPRTASSAPSVVSAADAEAAEARASIGGSQLAQVERGAALVVFQPPRPFDPAPAGIQIGRRIFARLESAGAASAFVAVPTAGEEEHVAIRLADVQRFATVKTGATRLRMLEGIDKGAWIRVRLDDGGYAQGVLHEVQPASLALASLNADGTAPEIRTIPEEKVIEIDGLLRSTVTRLTLAEVQGGEALALTLWPDAREIVGTVKDRSELFVLVECADGTTARIPFDGPVAEVRRIPPKWRNVAGGLKPGNVARVMYADDFDDARVEYDVIGTVVALTPHAITLESVDGTVAVPFDAVTSLAAAVSEAEAARAKPMKNSAIAAGIPVLPGAPAALAASLDPATGVSAITDGTVVRNVFVTAPFDGEVFGIRIGSRLARTKEATDLLFDTVVMPKRRLGAADTRRAEMISHSLEGRRVTLELDADGGVASIEIGAR